jgi:cytosine-specific methyltransferase
MKPNDPLRFNGETSTALSIVSSSGGGVDTGCVTIGSMFTGYGGLDMGVQMVIPNAHSAWFVEYDQAPASILNHHWPEVPNYGDVTEIDWKEMGRPLDETKDGGSGSPQIDILTAGYP